MLKSSKLRILALTSLMMGLSACAGDGMDKEPIGPGLTTEEGLSTVSPKHLPAIKYYKTFNLPRIFNTTWVKVDGTVFSGVTAYVKGWDTSTGISTFKDLSYEMSDGTKLTDGVLRWYNGVYGAVIMGPSIYILDGQGNKRVLKDPDDELHPLNMVMGVVGMRTPPETLSQMVVESKLPEKEYGSEGPSKAIQDDIDALDAFFAEGDVSKDDKKDDAKKDDDKKTDDPNAIPDKDKEDDKNNQVQPPKEEERKGFAIRYVGRAFSGEDQGDFLFKVEFGGKFRAAGVIAGLKNVAGFEIADRDDLPQFRDNPTLKSRPAIVLHWREQEFADIKQGTYEPMFTNDNVYETNVPSTLNKSFRPGQPIFSVTGRAEASVKPKGENDKTLWEGRYHIGIFGPAAEEVYGYVGFDVPDLSFTKGDPNAKDIFIPLIGVAGHDVDRMNPAYLRPEERRNHLLPNVTLGGGGGGGGK